MKLFKKQFKKNLAKFINNEYKKVGYNIDCIHSSSTTGITNSIYNIICLFGHKKKYIQINNENCFDGYHIDSKNMKMLNRNQIYKFFKYWGLELIQKSPNSTYHVNNGSSENNGYPYWYKFSNELNEIIQKTEQEIFYDLQSNKECNNLTQKNIENLQALNITNVIDLNNESIEYIKFNKNIIFEEIDLDAKFKEDYYDTIIQRIIFWDNDYIYLHNSTNIETYKDITPSMKSLCKYYM
jgi:hypothetical protein